MSIPLPSERLRLGHLEKTKSKRSVQPSNNEPSPKYVLQSQNKWTREQSFVWKEYQEEQKQNTTKKQASRNWTRQNTGTRTLYTSKYVLQTSRAQYRSISYNIIHVVLSNSSYRASHLAALYANCSHAANVLQELINLCLICANCPVNHKHQVKST